MGGALLRASQEESGDLLSHLANLLGSALPALTKAETRGGFLSAKIVASVRAEVNRRRPLARSRHRAGWIDAGGGAVKSRRRRSAT